MATTTRKSSPWRELNAAMVPRHPRRVARALADLPVDAVARWVGDEKPADAVRVLEQLPTAGEVLERLDPARAGSLLERADMRPAARWLAQLPRESRDAALQHVSEARAAELRELAEYPSDCAGYLMDPQVLAFSEAAHVRDVRRRIKDMRARRVQDVMLVDSAGRLVGSVPLQDIALAESSEPLRALASTQITPVQDTSGREEVMRVLGESRTGTVPVVNFEGELVGVLRQAELIEAATEAAAGDLLSMVGAGKDERSLAPPLLSVRKRLPWLMINLLTAFLAAAVVGIFEDTIATFTALAILLPVVAGQSGNTGAQAQAVTLRGLALREIRLRHWLRVAAKEMLVGTVNGVAIAVSCGVAVYIWNRSLGLVVVIATSMVLSMMAASLAGSMIPMILIKLRQDPAAASSIILTTVTDVVGFMSFLGIATLLSTWL